LGAQIGSQLLALAVEISHVGAGLMALVTVIMGVILLTNIGGQGVGHFVRSYIVSMILGTLFLFSFSVIGGFFQQGLGGGG
jgi:hypothetical protein